jgi:hypothetical protein
VCRIQDYVQVVLDFKTFYVLSVHMFYSEFEVTRFVISSRYLVEHKEVNVNVRDKWDSTPL